ncbi:MAG: hypothetical protein R3212_02600 [Xanthomonadales bacterium]|nr:hypothetical protein [Xanthomonadales bacterium]
MSDELNQAASEVLLAEPESQYGNQYRSDYLTQYRDYVATADSISARRNAANSFFLTLNTAFLGARGYFEVSGWETVIVQVLVGSLFSFVWWRMIQSYKALNTSKFTVIQLMEQNLPLASYSAEWFVHKNSPDSRSSLSSIESWIPGLFILLHVAVAVFYLIGTGTDG